MARDDVVIEVDRVVTRFGAQTVHDGVSFTVRRGTLVALIGGSGTGKSVLLREIIGLQRPTEGRIRLLGTDVWSSRAGRARRGAPALRHDVPGRRAVLFAHGRAERRRAAARARVACRRDLLDAPGRAAAGAGRAAGPDAAAKMPSELSGGMRKRAAIARALALEPEVLFLDEPTSGPRPDHRARLRRAWSARWSTTSGITVFLVTHDLDTLLTVVDRIIVLARGAVLADGTVRGDPGGRRPVDPVPTSRCAPRWLVSTPSLAIRRQQA